MESQPFYVQDCALIWRTANVYPAANLRELRVRLESCPPASLYHHFCETKLRATFDDPEYPNDFAVWAAHGLRDPVLAERLGVLNPYDYPNLDDLRVETLDIIDDRLAECPVVPWSQPGEQFHFMQAMTVVFDTGVVIESSEGMLPAISKMSLGSIYFHFIEARRRTLGGIDDFSAWLLSRGIEESNMIEAFRQIDFYFLALRELKDRLVSTLDLRFEKKAAS